MNLHELLQSRRPDIAARWRDLILDTYPEETAGFLRREKDRFQNPVGHGIVRGTRVLCDGLLAGKPATELAGAVDGLVRVGAVQDFAASRAVSFVFLFKRAVREVMGESLSKPVLQSEIAALDAAVDELALEVFDLYVRCREEIYTVRANELKRQTSRILKYLQRISRQQEDNMKLAGEDGHATGGCKA